jgi:hypothetical protein
MDEKCRYDLPKLSQEDINNLNRATTSNETEAVIVSQQRKARIIWIQC